MKYLRICGRPVLNMPDIGDCFQDTQGMRALLTPSRDRFLHGDFFPENILYNTDAGRWILLDPVSVRGVHRGDFVLDVNKMDDWLSGELPALRLGQFSVDIRGNDVDFTIHRQSGKLVKLAGYHLDDWYRERLEDPAYAHVFASEPGWEERYIFVKVFYSLCMLPLADKRQSLARYFIALESMADFIEKVENGGL